MKELLSAACFQTITEFKLTQCTGTHLTIRYSVLLKDLVKSDAKVSLASYQTVAEVLDLGFSINIQNRIGCPCSFEHTRKILGLLLRCPDSMLCSTVFHKAENLPRMNKNANVSLTRVGRQNDWITFILTARKLILYLLP